MDEFKRRFFDETAGALTPELEGAARSHSHPHRLQPLEKGKKNRGEKSSDNTNLRLEPRQP